MRNGNLFAGARGCFEDRGSIESMRNGNRFGSPRKKRLSQRSIESMRNGNPFRSCGCCSVGAGSIESMRNGNTFRFWYTVFLSSVQSNLWGMETFFEKTNSRRVGWFNRIYEEWKQRSLQGFCRCAFRFNRIYEEWKPVKHDYLSFLAERSIESMRNGNTAADRLL